VADGFAMSLEGCLFVAPEVPHSLQVQKASYFGNDLISVLRWVHGCAVT